MKPTIILAAAILICIACAPQDDSLATSPVEIERAAQQLWNDTHAFDYSAIRSATTPEVEYILFGSRMNIDDFEEMLREFEASLEGGSLDPYELREFNTKIIGNVAYTSWSSDEWLEAAVFIRQGDRWLLDRASAVEIETPSE